MFAFFLQALLLFVVEGAVGLGGLYLARGKIKQLLGDWISEALEAYIAELLERVRENPQAFSQEIQPLLQALFKPLAKGAPANGALPFEPAIRLPVVGKVPLSALAQLAQMFAGKTQQPQQTAALPQQQGVQKPAPQNVQVVKKKAFIG